MIRDKIFTPPGLIIMIVIILISIPLLEAEKLHYQRTETAVFVQAFFEGRPAGEGGFNHYAHMILVMQTSPTKIYTFEVPKDFFYGLKDQERVVIRKKVGQYTGITYKVTLDTNAHY